MQSLEWPQTGHRVFFFSFLATVFLAGGATAADEPSAAQKSNAGSAITILQTRLWSPDGKVPTGTIWRSFQTWQTDVARTEKGELIRVDPMTPRAGRNNKGELIRFFCDRPSYQLTQKFTKVEVCPVKAIHGSAWPRAGWQAPEFDDSDWIRDPYPQRGLYSLVALRCLRGKFEVADPAKVNDLSLTLRFRGGAVAYLNGKEIGRAFLPKGEIKPDTLAEDYPKEAYVDADGALIGQGLSYHGPDTRDPEFGKAIRTELGLVIWRGAAKWHSARVDNAAGYVSNDPEVVARYKSRCRTLEAKIPASMLRKGTNVLAIEIHRAPAWEGMFSSPSSYDGKKSLLALSPGQSWWDRAELEDVKLTATGAKDAAIPNLGPARGMRVWNHPASVQVDPSYYGDPTESLRPIRLRGAKNGTCSGQIVVSSVDPIRGLAVAVTELKGPQRAAIPASMIQLGFPTYANGVNGNMAKGTGRGPEIGSWPIYDPLDPVAPKEIADSKWSMGRTFPPLQPVWLTVRIPRDAKAGEYRGSVTVSADGETSVTTSLEVEVVGDWILPDATAFKTYIGLLECPDAVAGRYKVALWSEEHWKLLDKTFEVMGQIGTKDVFVPLVAKTHLGNPYSMVRWIKQADGTYLADTSIAERYIDMAVRHLGKLPVVCLYIATRSQYGRDPADGKDKPLAQPIVTELDPKTGELKDMLPPKWGTPEAQVFWKPVIDRMRDILAKRGVEKSMMFGYLADGLGPVAPDNTTGVPSHFSDLWAMAPNTRWMVSAHLAPGSWKAGKLKNTEILGGHSWMFATINNTQWMDDNDDSMWKLQYGWRDRKYPFFTIVASRSRSPTLTNDHCPNVSRWRVMPEAVLLSQYGGTTYQGFGSWGADFWGNECQTYDTYHNVALSENPVRWIVGPGSEGPVPTCRTRMLQEGLQEAEARIFVQDALLDREAKLGPELAKRCKELCDERTRAFSYMSSYRYTDGADSMPRLRVIPDAAAWDDATTELYKVADEVEKRLKR